MAAITVLATSSVVMTRGLLDRLTGMQLGAQAARWERARAFSFAFDFRAATAVYGAADPFTKGLHHAASVAGGYPLYGISDRHLVFLNALFPLAALLPVLSITATATALATGATLGLALTGACAVGVLTLTIRVSSALKGPPPPSLLTPVNTPAGDLSIVMRVGWAFSDPLTSIFGALTVTVLPVTPIPLVLMALWCTGVTLIRWSKRR